MKTVVTTLVGVLSLAIVPSAGAFHKHCHHWCCPCGPVHYGAAPGYAPGYTYRMPAMTYAPAGSFMAVPPASYYTPAFSYVPAASYSYAPAGSYSNAPSSSYNDPAAGLSIGSLTAVLDVLDRVTSWTDKHRGGSGASSKKVDDLARDVEEMKKTLATLKPVENLDERLKKISTDLQLHNAKFDKLDADIKAIKKKLDLP